VAKIRLLLPLVDVRKTGALHTIGGPETATAKDVATIHRARAPLKRLNMLSGIEGGRISTLTVSLSNSPSGRKKQKGRRTMARADPGYLSLENSPRENSPRQNPCAQCGKPIAAPEWTEDGPRRIAYLWHCRACDYRFEAVAFFCEAQPESLAA
jgi:hypothetical protein